MNRPVAAAPPGSPGTLVERGPAALRSEVLFPRTRAPLRSKTGSLLSPVLLSWASMYSEIQRERADIGGLMARPEHREWNPELIKPKKLLNPVKASRNHQEMHRELLMNHRRGLGVDSKPELQRVLEHRRRNQLIKKKKEELEAKRLQCPFEQELLRRQQRLNQLEKPPEKEEDHAPEFIKVRENLRRVTTFTSGERAL
ncbi:actin-associated protein FAM107A isoform X1 [Budorcas taxicolor]|uniref:actin-associated protein FAM107A isoform X1 n=2 Tax=Budorcas taxicolor TaxID=37181 RepID=UPI00228383BC|nr:actin-associated protein FAM107A isoform X1 [Budorcas taxicolor]